MSLKQKRNGEQSTQLDLILLHHCPSCIGSCLLLLLERLSKTKECVANLTDLIPHTIQIVHLDTKIYIYFKMNFKVLLVLMDMIHDEN
jgi:hypothetical protein